MAGTHWEIVLKDNGRGSTVMRDNEDLTDVISVKVSQLVGEPPFVDVRFVADTVYLEATEDAR